MPIADEHSLAVIRLIAFVAVAFNNIKFYMHIWDMNLTGHISFDII